MALQDFIEIKAGTKIRGCLINTERNKALLEEIPHRDFLDLSLVYTMELPSPEDRRRNIVADNRLLASWGISEAELYESVYTELENGTEVLFERMDAITGQMINWEDYPDASSLPLYVLTNKNLYCGAVQMLNKKILRDAADTMGTDYIILPSSVHELILVSVDWGGRDPGYARELAGIVYQVNETQVPESDILSYHVYRYSRENGEITIAA